VKEQRHDRKVLCGVFAVLGFVLLAVGEISRRQWH
jgi:hypothetical protein